MDRFEWARLPEPARSAFEAEFGRVRAATTTPTGLTVGIASRVETEHAVVFVKAIPVRSPMLPGYERELAVAEALPPAVPAPQLLWVSEGGWLTLVFEYILGRHVDLVQDADEVMAMLESIRDPLDPSPVSGLRPISEKLSAILAGAQAAVADPPEGLSGTEAYRAIIARASLDDFAGESLIHADLTPSNMIHDGTRVQLIDWALASRGAAWLDVALLIPSLIGAGYSPAEAERWAAGYPDWKKASARSLDLLAVMRLLFLAEMARSGPVWLAKDRRDSLWVHEAWARHRLS